MSERISDETLAILIDLYQLPDASYEYEGTALCAFLELRERRVADAEQAQSAEDAYWAWLNDDDAFHEDLRDGFKAGYAAGARGQSG